MSKGKFSAALGTLAAVLLLAAGCGGSSESGLTKAEYVKQGNAICKKSEEERGKLVAGALKLVKPGEEATAATQEKVVRTALVAPYREMTKQLDALEAPEADEQQIEDLIKAMENAADTADEKPLGNLHSDAQFSEANEMASKYGLTTCVI